MYKAKKVRNKTSSRQALSALFFIGMPAREKAINWELRRKRINKIRVLLAESGVEDSELRRHIIEGFKAASKKNNEAFWSAAKNIEECVKKSEIIKKALLKELETRISKEERLKAIKKGRLELQPSLKKLWSTLDEDLRSKPEVREMFKKASLMRDDPNKYFNYIKLFKKLRALSGLI